MDISKDISTLRRIAREGQIKNKGYDVLRLRETANHILALYENNRSLGAALALCMKFIDGHFHSLEADVVVLEEAEALVMAVEQAMSLNEYSEPETSIWLQADESGRLDAGHHVIIDREFAEQLKAEATLAEWAGHPNLETMAKLLGPIFGVDNIVEDKPEKTDEPTEPTE